MPKYLVHQRLTDFGLALIKDHGMSDAFRATTQMAGGAGGKLEAMYLTFESGPTIVAIFDLTHEQAAALCVAASRGPIGEARVTPLLTIEEVNKASAAQRAWTGVPEMPTQVTDRWPPEAGDGPEAEVVATS
ncbi:MAG: hypothetical protein J2P58_02415 [Acidimicrobiaceae bacterium]|nr:hypothetical protein [Acidimicrobiaceae bacterium]MBO0747487.1 hypothetical protein [Acidimicrobiaceae bacterium]